MSDKIKPVEKSFNIRVTEARQSIVKAMVDCQLPATVLQLILADITKKIDDETSAIISSEIYTYKENLNKQESTK